MLDIECPDRAVGRTPVIWLFIECHLLAEITESTKGLTIYIVGIQVIKRCPIEGLSAEYVNKALHDARRMSIPWCRRVARNSRLSPFVRNRIVEPKIVVTSVFTFSAKSGIRMFRGGIMHSSKGPLSLNETQI
jgi:hypothetical protein